MMAPRRQARLGIVRSGGGKGSRCLRSECNRVARSLQADTDGGQISGSPPQ